MTCIIIIKVISQAARTAVDSETLVYAELGPSSFRSQFSHEPIIHIVDDDRVELNKHKLQESQEVKNKPAADPGINIYHCARQYYRSVILEFVHGLKGYIHQYQFLFFFYLNFDTVDSFIVNLDNLLVQLQPEVSSCWY